MHGKPDSYREFFLKKWTDYVVSNENWSILQAKFINAQIKNIKSDSEQVDKIKNVNSKSSGKSVNFPKTEKP